MNQTKKRRYVWYRICLALSCGLTFGLLTYFEVIRNHGWIVWGITALVALFILDWLNAVAFKQKSRPWHVWPKEEDRDF